jgi:hypothetical protein
MKGNSDRNLLAHHRLLTGLARATPLLRSRLSVFPKLDNVLCVAATVGDNVFAKANHLDVEVFALSSRDCSLHCVGHNSLPFRYQSR